jgi:hypothetical protein
LPEHALNRSGNPDPGPPLLTSVFFGIKAAADHLTHSEPHSTWAAECNGKGDLEKLRFSFKIKARMEIFPQAYS